MSSDLHSRKGWMGLLARCRAAELAALWDKLALAPGFEVLRAAEIGGVMVRGRAGSIGAPFNLGEMTVTRASVQLDDGAVGHAYVQGRDKAKAEQAALIDALMQTDAADQIRRAILMPLAQDEADRRAARAARAAATKVDFFTMARGED